MNPKRKRRKPIIKRKLILIMEFEAIAVIPQTEQNETHQADVVQVNIHLDHDFLNSLNLTSHQLFLFLKIKKN